MELQLILPLSFPDKSEEKTDCLNYNRKFITVEPFSIKVWGIVSINDVGMVLEWCWKLRKWLMTPLTTSVRQQGT